MFLKTNQNSKELNLSDLERIASMHIKPSKVHQTSRYPGWKFRFFLDKIKHFYEFDRESIILERDDNGLISGILIYSYNERDFNEFSGPRHLRFYIMVLKTILGFYGWQFKKYLVAAKSMLGIKTLTTSIQNDENFAKIWVLIVAEEDRKKGIATKLLEKCVKNLKERGIKKIRVTVKKDNIPAIKTYEKYGFRTVGEYLESSGDSYVMEINI